MDRLSRFAPLYRSSPGAKSILRRYLGLEADATVPLSLSHGLDFNHHKGVPQDYVASEPLHWCYNADILSRTDESKPGVELPHPWLMVRELLDLEDLSPEPGRALVIGPPPSPTNDTGLLEGLERAGLRADSILVKERGADAFRASLAFWKEHGIEPVSAGPHDDDHYFRLATILSGYDRIILPVFSSVGVFAAALGCEVVPLTDYWHCSYAPLDLDLDHYAKTPRARSFARLFVDADRDTQQRESIAFLGGALQAPVAQLRQRFLDAVGSVTEPIHAPAAPNHPLLRAAMIWFAMVTGKIGFLSYGFGPAVFYKFLGTKSALVCKEVNMIDALLKGGIDPSNFKSRPLRQDEASARSGEGAVY